VEKVEAQRAEPVPPAQLLKPALRTVHTVQRMPRGDGGSVACT
jgi:hypothetical protein